MSGVRVPPGWPIYRPRVSEKLNKQSIAGATFAVVRELHATKDGARGPRYFERWIERMEKDLFPWIGSLPLAEITAPLLLQTLRRIEARGANETAHTLRQTAGQVFRYGIATGRCERNPAADLHGALRPIIVKHMAAVLEPSGVGVCRPHSVPLSSRAVEILQEVYPLTGHGQYVFPSLLTGERPMSENTSRTALRRMGYTNDDMTPHGIRAMARTILVEHLSVHPDVIEAQLAHGKSGPLGAAYDSRRVSRATPANDGRLVSLLNAPARRRNGRTGEVKAQEGPRVDERSCRLELC